MILFGVNTTPETMEITIVDLDSKDHIEIEIDNIEDAANLSEAFYKLSVALATLFPKTTIH